SRGRHGCARGARPSRRARRSRGSCRERRSWWKRRRSRAGERRRRGEDSCPCARRPGAAPCLEKAVLHELSVQKFRGLRDFTMSGLGRVNLLVGANNCGKTTVLEALHILLRAGDPWALWSALSRRGEDVQTPPAVRPNREM